MTSIKLTPARCDVDFTVGTDIDDLFLVFVDDAGAAVDVSSYTIEAKVLRGTEVLVTDFTPTVSGVGNNTVQLAMTDTETTTIGVERGLTWSLRMTLAEITKEWVAGELVGFGQGTARRGNSTASVFTVGEVTVTLSSAAPIDTVRAAIANDIANPASAISVELASQYALVGSGTLPAGGSTGQALVKASATDLDVEWGTVAGSGASALAVNAQVGTTYTLVLGDAGDLVTLSNASAITLTVPPNASVAFPVGTTVYLNQLGAGQVTVAPGSGVSISTPASLKSRTQYSTLALVKTGENTWLLSGDVEPIGQATNAQTGTTYTLALSDADDLVTLSNAGAITLTVPPNSSVAFPVGTRIDLLQLGAGQVTVAQGAGVTVNATPSLLARAQYSGMTLIKLSTDGWVLVGDLA